MILIVSDTFLAYTFALYLRDEKSVNKDSYIHTHHITRSTLALTDWILNHQHRLRVGNS